MNFKNLNKDLTQYCLRSGVVIRRFPKDPKQNVAGDLPIWFPPAYSLTAEDAMRGLSLSSDQIASLINLQEKEICHNDKEAAYLFFRFPIRALLEDYPTFRFTFSPDYRNDKLLRRGFCHVTLNIDPDGLLSRKEKEREWRSARTMITAYVKLHQEIVGGIELADLALL